MAVMQSHGYLTFLQKYVTPKTINVGMQHPMMIWLELYLLDLVSYSELYQQNIFVGELRQLSCGSWNTLDLGGGKIKCLQARKNKMTLDQARARCDLFGAEIPVPKNTAENEKYRAQFEYFSNGELNFIYL